MSRHHFQPISMLKSNI